MLKKIFRRTFFWAAVLIIILYAINKFPDRFNDATTAYRNGDYTKAMQLWRTLADTGDSAAQANVGALYKNGQGVELSEEKAYEWYALAADAGNPTAQYEVGKHFEFGNVVAASLPLALMWIQKSAEQGYPPAIADIGLKYLLGVGVVQNRKTAQAWLDRINGPNRNAPILYGEHLNDVAYVVPCAHE